MFIRNWKLIETQYLCQIFIEVPVLSLPCLISERGVFYQVHDNTTWSSS